MMNPRTEKTERTRGGTRVAFRYYLFLFFRAVPPPAAK
jgi:hypothetical protein